MKKAIIWIIVVIIVLAIIGVAIWFFFFKKSDEGGKCRNTNQCITEMNCVSHKCSSGKIGSVCDTRKSCQKDLLCQKNACIAKLDFSKYYSSVEISKIKPGSPPGPDNPLVATTTFTAADGIEIDFKGVKPSTTGEYYINIVNLDTGEVTNSTQGKMDTKFEGRDVGMGTDLQSMPAGEYDVEVYFQNQLIYSTPITISS